jgi:hypothetical protein
VSHGNRVGDECRPLNSRLVYPFVLMAGRLLREGRINPGNAAHLLREGQHRIDMRRIDFGEPAQFLHGSKEGVEFNRPAFVDVLQHRSPMRADAGGAVDAALDIDTEMHADAPADLLRL